MSWGFFADLRLAVSTTAYERILGLRPADAALKRGWSRLADASLEESLGRPGRATKTFAEAVAMYAPPNAIRTVSRKKAQAELRIAIGVDGSRLDEVQPLAALLFCAASERGKGSLRLVDDGSLGLDGIELRLAGGKISRAKVDDWESIVAELARELGGQEPRGAARVKPFAGVEAPAVAPPPSDEPPPPPLVLSELPAALENAVAADFRLPAGAILKRQKNAVGSNLDAECCRLEWIGDPAAIAALRAQIETLPKDAKGCRKRIEHCIATLSSRAR